MVLNWRGLLKVVVILAVDNLIHEFKKEVQEGDAIWELLENMGYLNQWDQLNQHQNVCKQRRGPKAELQAYQYIEEYTGG